MHHGALTGFVTLFPVMHYAMSFLVSMAYSCQEVTQALCNSDNFSKWLKCLTLDAPEVTFMKYSIFNLF